LRFVCVSESTARHNTPSPNRNPVQRVLQRWPTDVAKLSKLPDGRTSRNYRKWIVIRNDTERLNLPNLAGAFIVPDNAPARRPAVS